jgi:hypothetical protein
MRAAGAAQAKMDNKRIYIALMIVGFAITIAGILLRRAGGPSLQTTGTIIGWSGIGIALIARILFGKRRTQPRSKNEPS